MYRRKTTPSSTTRRMGSERARVEKGKNVIRDSILMKRRVRQAFSLCTFIVEYLVMITDGLRRPRTLKGRSLLVRDFRFKVRIRGFTFVRVQTERQRGLVLLLLDFLVEVVDICVRVRLRLSGGFDERFAIGGTVVGLVHDYR